MTIICQQSRTYEPQWRREVRTCEGRSRSGIDPDVLFPDERCRGAVANDGGSLLGLSWSNIRDLDG
jgi:hypothetical protein